MKNRLTPFAIFFAVGLYGVFVIPTQANAQIIGDVVNASNTFENPAFFGGSEFIFDFGSGTVADPGVELSSFAGIYDVDFSSNSMTMTLLSNAGLSFLNYAAGTFDRYYFGFDGHTVDSVTAAGGSTQLTNGLTVGLLPANYDLNVPDSFGTGISVPVNYPNGGFFIELGEGTDLNTLNTTLSVDFAATAVPEPSSAISLALALLLAAGRRRRS